MTLVDIKTMTYTNIWIEYNDADTRPGLSAGKIILLCSGCVVLSFLVVMMGLYLYRRTKDNVDADDEDPSFEEMEKDIGHVVFPINDTIQVESNSENSFEEVTLDNPMKLRADSDDLKDGSDSFDQDQNYNEKVINIEI